MSLHSIVRLLGSIHRRPIVRLATLGLVSCLASSAPAAIHYYYGNVPVAQGTVQPLDVNFEGDDFDDIELENYVNQGVNYQGVRIPYTPGRVVGFSTGTDFYASALSAGAAINSATTSTSYFGTLANGPGDPNSQFDNASHTYVGFSFPIGGTALYYGWVRVNINPAAGTMTAVDWAYQDQLGVGIAAGDVGTAAMAGDLNGDKRINGGDFLYWQRNRAAITPFQYYDWERYYGGGLPATAVVSGAPEPPAAVIAVAAIALALVPAIRRALK